MEERIKKVIQYVPHHKMGVKILDKNQLKNIFPNYVSLQNKIEKHREFIQKFWKSQQRNNSEYIFFDDQYNMMFDNVYSIMGKRGSGKTSALYTLKNLFKNNENDVVLPVITSELVPESFELIGWILSLMENVVKELQEEIDAKNSKKETNLWAECRVGEKKNTLLSDFNKVKELCFSKMYNGKNGDSFSEIIVDVERSTQNSFDFSQKLTRFWTYFKDTVRDLRGGKEPLIYIMFDDVDLSPEKIWELLSTIVKYLSHPNVIVLVTADEDMLYEVVKNILYTKMMSTKVCEKLTVEKNGFMKQPRCILERSCRHLHVIILRTLILTPGRLHLLKIWKLLMEMLVQSVSNYLWKGRLTIILDVWA